MNGYLVDTNVLSELTKPLPDPRVGEFLVGAGKERVYVSVVTIGEIAKGIGGLPEGKRRAELRAWLNEVMRPWFSGRVLPVTDAIAERWGTLAGDQRRHGRQVTMADGLITATALEHGLTLATRNIKDFAGLGVEFLNPWESAPTP